MYDLLHLGELHAHQVRTWLVDGGALTGSTTSVREVLAIPEGYCLRLARAVWGKRASPALSQRDVDGIVEAFLAAVREVNGSGKDAETT